jgi:hydroxypyruvate isomerase
LALTGKLEVPVANGRIDVLSEDYAIEVDRMEKWHEGIGQAAHYSQATGKIACLALIIDSDRWPLNEATLSKLRTIEKTAVARGVKLLILRRVAPDA